MAESVEITDLRSTPPRMYLTLTVTLTEFAVAKLFQLMTRRYQQATPAEDVYIHGKHIYAELLVHLADMI